MVPLVPPRAQQSRLLHPVRSVAQLVRLMNWYAYLFQVKQAEER